MHRRLVTGFALCCLLAASASAAPATPRILSGNDLLQVCETPALDPDQATQNIRCLYFVGDIVFGKGWRELISIEDAQGKKCIPEGVNVGQLKDISIKYLRDNPQVRHNGAEALVLQSILQAFPNCKVRWLK